MFITDKGAGLEEAAAFFGWNNIFNRKHFTNKTVTKRHGLNELAKFQNDIHLILDAPTVSDLKNLIAHAMNEHTTKSAQDFIKPISNIRHEVCFAYTCKFFTFGHVSDQRSECGMSSIKARGKLKEQLSKAMFTESFDRIFATVRDQGTERLTLLVGHRQQGDRVGAR